MSGFLENGLSNCSGAEVNLQQDGVCSLRLVKLSLAKKLIQIDAKKEYSGTLDEVVAENKITGPLAITLTGKGILIKKTARLEVISEQNLQHLFPQMKLEEFYIQHFPAAEQSFIAVVRKEIADAVVSTLKKHGIEILILSLGPFVVDQVIAQINSYDGSLRFDGHQILMNEVKVWQNYTYSPAVKAPFPLKIDIELMPEQFLLAYATAFQLILNDRLDLISVEAPEIKQNLIELSSKLKFTKYGSFMLVFFFVLLMINFLMFSSYNSSNQELMNRAGQKSSVFENRQKLEEEVKIKESKVQKLGWNRGYPYAYICDQIGQTVPKEIKLEEIQVNTLFAGNSSLIKEAQAANGSIRVKGQTSSVYAINDWIYILKEKNWIKNVQLEKYTADDQKQAQVFTIYLSY